eukprot:m.182216 g.182216  ORF g.182216 m.182216 type:complete len:372 (+) comp15472_c0_seq1:132-1247(+)
MQQEEMSVGGEAHTPGEDPEDTVWSKDTEEAFCEALQLYPPCGRRKIVLGDEGKMYGRNELIALHIFNKTGKVRTRKQVSSHIQVLARKQQRETNQRFEGQSSAQIVTLSMGGRGSMDGSSGVGNAGHALDAGRRGIPRFVFGTGGNRPVRELPPQKLHLDSFHAYIRYHQSDHRHNFVAIDKPGAYEAPHMESVDILQVCDKFPGLRQLYRDHPLTPLFLVKFWVDLSYDLSPNNTGFYGTAAVYTSTESMRVERSTSVISLGKQVIEKIQVESGTPEGGRMVYRFEDAPMCDYMVTFIEKLRSIASPELVNKVLENFSVVQVLRNEATQEILTCKAYMFETSLRGYGAHHTIYRMHESSTADADRRFTA